MQNIMIKLPAFVSDGRAARWLGDQSEAMQEPLGHDRSVPNRFHDHITLLYSGDEAADKAERFPRRGERAFYDLGVVSIVRKYPQTPEAARRGMGLAPAIGIIRPVVDGKPGCRVEQSAPAEGSAAALACLCPPR